MREPLFIDACFLNKIAGHRTALALGLSMSQKLITAAILLNFPSHVSEKHLRLFFTREDFFRFMERLRPNFTHCSLASNTIIQKTNRYFHFIELFNEMDHISCIAAKSPTFSET
jgi:hypothetical protein